MNLVKILSRKIYLSIFIISSLSTLIFILIEEIDSSIKNNIFAQINNYYENFDLRINKNDTLIKFLNEYKIVHAKMIEIEGIISQNAHTQSFLAQGITTYPTEKFTHKKSVLGLKLAKSLGCSILEHQSPLQMNTQMIPILECPALFITTFEKNSSYTMLLSDIEEVIYYGIDFMDLSIIKIDYNQISTIPSSNKKEYILIKDRDKGILNEFKDLEIIPIKDDISRFYEYTFIHKHFKKILLLVIILLNILIHLMLITNNRSLIYSKLLWGLGLHKKNITKIYFTYRIKYTLISIIFILFSFYTILFFINKLPFTYEEIRFYMNPIPQNLIHPLKYLYYIMLIYMPLILLNIIIHYHHLKQLHKFSPHE